MRLLLALVFAGLAWTQGSVTEQAWKMLAQDRRSEAAALLQSAIRTNPGNAEAHLLLGSIFAEAGDLAGAIPHLRAGVLLRPKDALAHNALGEALSDAGDLQSADAEFRTAAALDPRMAQAQENLGQVLLRSGDLQGAAAPLDRAIRLLGETDASASARYLRARVWSELGELREAEKELGKAVVLRQEFAEAWSDLGYVRERAGDEKGALAALLRAAEIQPDGEVAQRRLGALYLKLGHANDAVRHLEHAVRLSPDDQTALNTLQLALRQTGNIERANQTKAKLAEMLRARDRASENALAAARLNNEGAAMEKSGKVAGAAEKYRAAVELNPGHAGMRVNYAIALLKLGQWEPGLRELQTAVNQDPANERFRKALDDAMSQAPPKLRKSR